MTFPGLSEMERNYNRVLWGALMQWAWRNGYTVQVSPMVQGPNDGCFLMMTITYLGGSVWSFTGYESQVLSKWRLEHPDVV